MSTNTPILTYLIIVLTGIFTYQGFRNTGLFYRYLFEPVAVLKRREYERLITSGFLHADWMHFAFNMFSLYSFGQYLETSYGLQSLLIIYVASIVGGNLLALAIHRKDMYRALGASGGVCGVIFASVFLLPGGSIFIFPLPIPIPSWLFAILFLGISIYGIRTRRGNIGHDAHLGGALVGLAVTFLLWPHLVLHQWPLAVVILAVSALFFLLLFKGWPSKRT